MELDSPPAYSPGLQVVVDTALAFCSEKGQEQVGGVIEEEGDGSSFAAGRNLTHGKVSRGIAGRNGQGELTENVPDLLSWEPRKARLLVKGFATW